MASFATTFAFLILAIASPGLVAYRKQKDSIEVASSGTAAFNPIGAVKRRAKQRYANHKAKKEFQPVNDFVFAEGMDVKEPVGTGAFGDVLRVHDMATTRDFAMKVISPQDFSDSYSLNDLRRETRVQELLVDSDDIVGIHQKLRKDSGDFVVLTEFMPDGDLFHKIRRGGGLKNGFDVRDTFHQVANGLKFCHDRDVVHLDLKPENIWCRDKDQKVKIGDFSSAMEVEDKRPEMLKARGTPSYMAPEMLQSWVEEGQRGGSHSALDLKAVDVWALGVAFYTMLTGQMPWTIRVNRRQTAIKFLKKIHSASGPDISAVFRPLPASVDKDAADLIQHMLELDPTKRYTMEQVVSHKYFKNLARRQKSVEETTQEKTEEPFTIAQIMADRDLLSKEGHGIDLVKLAKQEQSVAAFADSLGDSNTRSSQLKFRDHDYKDHELDAATKS
jgi:serine/threonine protein kinase